MENNKNNYMVVYIMLAALSGVLWLLLIGLKAFGVVSMHWALVLSGIVWITWSLLALFAQLVAVVHCVVKLKRRYMFWKLRRYTKTWYEAARIIRTTGGEGLDEIAESFFPLVKPRQPGETDTQLRDLIMEQYVKFLEIAAWEYCKIERKPGETDACLRIRCMNAGLRKTQKKGVKK